MKQAQQRPPVTPLWSWDPCQVCPKLGEDTWSSIQALDEGVQGELSPWSRCFSAKTILKEGRQRRGTLGHVPSHQGNEASALRGHLSCASWHLPIPQNDKMHERMLNTKCRPEFLLDENSRPLSSTCSHLCLAFAITWALFGCSQVTTHIFIYPISTLLIFQNSIHVSGFPLLSRKLFLFCLVLLCLLQWRPIILLGSLFFFLLKLTPKG